MRRVDLRGERGTVALPELLVAMIISVAVLGGTLAIFEHFLTVSRDSAERNDAQQEARIGIEQLARDLRNLASPTANQPQAIDQAGASDLIFQTVDANGPNAGANLANVKRVRYCVDATGRLWLQTQTWTSSGVPAVPATACGVQGGWTAQRVLVGHVTNAARPVFVYNAAAATDISAIHVDLALDRSASSGPKETTLSTGVFLRNQNRRPTAGFSATPSTKGIVLNGSESADPEGDTLSYAWYDGAATQPSGTGITFTLPAVRNSTHVIKLVVSDPAGLTAEITKTVTA